MRIIRNRFLPLRGFSAMNLLGVLLVRPETHFSTRLVRHERIHTRQMRELLYVGFYVWYIIEWLVRLLLRGNAYRQISFEREAYTHESDPKYLDSRPLWAFLKYLKG